MSDTRLRWWEWMLLIVVVWPAWLACVAFVVLWLVACIFYTQHPSIGGSALGGFGLAILFDLRPPPLDK